MGQPMAAELLSAFPPPASNSSNAPYAGAQWFFYETGTLTGQAVYADAGLNTSLGDTVTADSAGRFPAIYFDPEKKYRGVLKNASGSEVIYDFDPINPSILADLASTSGGSMIKLSSGLTVEQRLAAFPKSLADYNADVGTGDAAADTAALLLAAADLADGTISILRLPAATLYLLQQVDINAPPGRIAVIGEGRDATRIVTQVNTGNTTQKQFPFVVRNTAHGTLIRDFSIEVDAPDVALFQNAFTFANVSNLVLENFGSYGSDQYGIGIFDDTIAAPGSRTALACNNIVIRNGIVKDASQYGLQHFPKVLSDGLLVENMQFVNCGTNVQAWTVPSQIEPAAIKCGQATRGTVLNNVLIECAEEAVALAISNYEDYTARGVTILNPGRQAISLSAGTHPSLITRYPATVGGATPAPYVPGHARVDLELSVYHNPKTAGLRTLPLITGQIGRAGQPPVKVASIANLTLSGEQTVDGVALVTSDRVLVKAQTDASENGIYVVDAGAWTRASDFDGAGEVVNGAVVNVTGGTQRGAWIVNTADPITIGTTAINWQRFEPGPIRIAMKADGDMYSTDGFSESYEGVVHMAFGIDYAGLDLDVRWSAGSTTGLAGSPALPPYVVYLTNNSTGKSVGARVKVDAANPYRLQATTFNALWLKGQESAEADVRISNGGQFAVRFDDNTGATRLKFDGENINLKDDPGSGMITVSGSTGTYYIDSPRYAQQSGVGNADYWVLGGGAAPVYLTNPRSNVALPASVDPMVIYQDARRGTATLSTGAATVLFGALSEPDDAYFVELEAGVGETFFVTDKTVSGFKINSTTGVSTATVGWKVTR